MELMLSNEFKTISVEECYNVTGGMSAVQAVTATLGVGSLAWAAPIAMVCPLAGAGLLLVGAGLTINSFS